ncbi:MAG: type II secretion system F family protein [Woeseia sp.]
MEALIDFLRSFVSDEAGLRQSVIVVVAATIFVFGLGVSVLVAAFTNPVRRRLGLIKEKESTDGRLAIRIATAVGPVAAFVLPKEELERNKVQRNMIRAGIRSPTALQVFYAIKTLLAVIIPILVLSGARFFPEMQTQAVVMYAMMGAGVGLLAPNYVLYRKVESRMKRLRHGFPDALDLLVVCVESGLGLGPALQRVAEELGVSHPDLSFELATVTAEIRAGVQREAALKNLAERTGLSDVRGLVGLLVQSMRFGTSVADALRVYSDDFRDKRMQAAEEQAAKMSTKLIFPLVLFMFPVFFIVAIGPAVIRIIDAFSKAGGG